MTYLVPTQRHTYVRFRLTQVTQVDKNIPADYKNQMKIIMQWAGYVASVECAYPISSKKRKAICPIEIECVTTVCICIVENTTVLKKNS